MYEVYKVVCSMNGLKAPGPDGCQPIFFQKYWQTINTSMFNIISNCFDSHILLNWLNESLITFISNPETIY